MTAYTVYMTKYDKTDRALKISTNEFYLCGNCKVYVTCERITMREDIMLCTKCYYAETLK